MSYLVTTVIYDKSEEKVKQSYLHNSIIKNETKEKIMDKVITCSQGLKQNALTSQDLAPMKC